MKIPSISFSVEWWLTELKEHPQNHIGPACVSAATTLLVGVIWGRYQALLFVCLAAASYPLTHHQIEYLMYLDVHETVYAVAIVGIQLFCMQFPYLSQWGLPMSVALAYSCTVRGMRLRAILQEQRLAIDKLSNLNHTLKEQTDLLVENSTNLEQALKKLAEEVLKKNELVQVEQETRDQKEETVVKINQDYAALNQKLKSLTDICQKFIEAKGVDEQLIEMDKNGQAIQRQTAQINLKNKELDSVIKNLQNANEKFNDLIEKAKGSEEKVREALKQFHQWLLSLNKPHYLM